MTRSQPLHCTWPRSATPAPGERVRGGWIDRVGVSAVGDGQWPRTWLVTCSLVSHRPCPGRERQLATHQRQHSDVVYLRRGNSVTIKLNCRRYNAYLRHDTWRYRRPAAARTLTPPVNLTLTVTITFQTTIIYSLVHILTIPQVSRKSTYNILSYSVHKQRDIK